jgi:hypothetical protein
MHVRMADLGVARVLERVVGIMRLIGCCEAQVLVDPDLTTATREWTPLHDAELGRVDERREQALGIGEHLRLDVSLQPRHGPLEFEIVRGRLVGEEQATHGREQQLVGRPGRERDELLARRRWGMHAGHR